MTSIRYRLEHPDRVKASRDAYKRRNPERVKAEKQAWKRSLVHKRMRHHEFVGIDGEGWNLDEHVYGMLVTSERTRYLYTGKPLTTEQCLSFIASLQYGKGTYIVGYFFDYDVTMILRDFARDRPDDAARLFSSGSKRYVWWRGYGIRYRPHKSLTVKRWTDDDSSPAVTIHDVQGFYQCSFVKALTKFNVTDGETLSRIADMKGQRSVFTPDRAADILAYSQLECELLVRLMNRLRGLSEQAGINAEPYEGPGRLASRAMEQFYGRKRHQDTVAAMPDALRSTVMAAMYGGRFENTAVGAVGVPIREYDKHSAYPAAMTALPCLIHGRWTRTRTNRGLLNLSHVRFRDDQEPDWGLCYPLPIRRKTGALQYPREGSGWYWDHEYRDIPTLDYTESGTWSWFPDGCDCKPFDWIHRLFAQRERMEEQEPGSGVCLKLALNTLYGKCAQTRPIAGPWLNMVYASLITSSLRSDMYQLYMSLPARSAVMFATDAIFTRDTLPITHGLGGLELANTYDSLVIVQPGLYYDSASAHFKTRGIPKQYIQDHGRNIRQFADVGIPYPMEVAQFKGLRLSLAQNNPTDMGNWVRTVRTVETRTLSKRIGKETIDGIHWTLPADNDNPDGESYERDFSSIADTDRDMSDMSFDDETLGDWE